MNYNKKDALKIYIGDKDLSDHVAQKFDVDYEFLISLQKEDDWSFIIKTSALLETLVSDIIIANINNKQLHSHINKLNMSGATGKLKLAKDMNILSDELKNLCDAVLPIRNKFVHSTKYLHESLNRYILDESQSNIIKQLKKTIPPNLNQNPPDVGEVVDLAQILKDDPRTYIFNALTLILGSDLLNFTNSNNTMQTHTN